MLGVGKYLLGGAFLCRCARTSAPFGRTYRGYIPSKRVCFYGLKLHLLASNDRFLWEVGLSPGATADVDGLYLLPLDLAAGSELYANRGYTDYQAEDDLPAQGIQLYPTRKHNSKRYHQPSQFIAIQGRKIMESRGFVFAHNCKRLTGVL